MMSSIPAEKIAHARGRLARAETCRSPAITGQRHLARKVHASVTRSVSEETAVTCFLAHASGYDPHSSGAVELRTRRIRPPGARRRTGFSLLEVLIATGILLGSIIVLGQLAGIGRRSALSARQLGTAQNLCQTRMNEILAGIVPAEEMDEEPLEETAVDGQPGWVVSVAVKPLDQTDLLAVRVTVLEALAEGSDKDAVENSFRPQFTLVRWIHASRDSVPSGSGAAATANPQTPASPFAGGSKR